MARERGRCPLWTMRATNLPLQASDRFLRLTAWEVAEVHSKMPGIRASTHSSKRRHTAWSDSSRTRSLPLLPTRRRMRHTSTSTSRRNSNSSKIRAPTPMPRPSHQSTTRHVTTLWLPTARKLVRLVLREMQSTHRQLEHQRWSAHPHTKSSHAVEHARTRSPLCQILRPQQQPQAAPPRSFRRETIRSLQSCLTITLSRGVKRVGLQRLQLSPAWTRRMTLNS